MSVDVRTRPSVQGDRTRTRLLGILVLSIATAIVLYRSTFLLMADKWSDDVAFAYGFVVAPISLWLIWERREWLQHVEFQPSWLGVIALPLAGALWVVAKGTGVLVIEELAAVLLIQALVLALLGLRAVRAMLFPIAFLLFLVPFGRALVPWLVDTTADIATWLLQRSGIPVYRTAAMITIPGAWFEIARACSGVSFLMTALVLGTLYAQLNFQSWRKRVVAVFLAGAIPVIANALRVYIIIGTSYLTHLRFGPGVEHVRFGQIFFIAVMLATFWVGVRWHDPPATMPGWLRSRASVPMRVPYYQGLLIALSLAGMMLAPSYQAAFARELQVRQVDASAAIGMPSHGAQEWTPRPETQAVDAWQPQYHGGLATRQGSYLNRTGGRVDAFVAVYGLGAVGDSEMISYDNMLSTQEETIVASSSNRRVELAGRVLTVREVVLPDDRPGHLVWQWYVVGDRPSTSPYVVKALEALNWITRGAADERVVTLATRNDDDAASRLEDFARAYGACVGGSFAARSCAP